MKPNNIKELREAITAKLQSLCEEFGADVATFHLYDTMQDQLIFPVGVGLRQVRQFEWLPSERGPAAAILRSGNPVFADDAEHHPQFRGRFTFDEEIKSGAAFPFFSSAGRELGIIFLNYRDPHAFSSDEEKLVTRAVATVSSEIRDWLTDDLWAEIRAQAGLRREQVALQDIARAACELLSDTEAIIWLLERDAGLTANAHSDFAGFSGPIVGTAIDASEPNVVSHALRTRDVQSAAVGTEMWPQDDLHREGAERRRWQSAWAFPMGDSGVLTIYTVGYSALTKRELDVGHAFAEQARATVAAHNRIMILEALGDVGNKLNLVFDRPEELLNAVVETAARVMNADWITLHQHDPERRSFLGVEHSITYPPERREGLATPREEGGASAYVRDEGRIPIPNLDEADPEVVRTAHVLELEVKAYYGVRLEANGETVGVLFFNYRQPREFTRDDITIVNLFADYAASAIRNARLLARMREREKDLDALNDLGRELTSGIRLEEEVVVDLIYQQASRLMDMDNCYIALYDKDSNTIRFALVMERGERIPEEKLVPGSKSGWAPRSFGAGRTEEIITSRKHLFHETKTEAEAWYAQPERQAYVKTISASWIGVPMIAGDQVFGVIAAYEPEHDNVYDDHDLEVLISIASYGAIALDNSRLYYDVVQELERRNRDLLTLNELGRELTAGIRLKPDEIVGLIYEQASKLMDTNNMYIALYDELNDTVQFRLAIVEGSRINVQPRQRGKGRTEEIIRTKKPILIATKAEAEDWYDEPGREDYLTREMLPSWLGVPMMVGEKALGVIATYHPTREHVYSKDDLTILQAMANQSAIALDNAMLYYDVVQDLEESNRDREQRIEDLESLQKIVQAIASERNIETLLERVATEARESVGADDAAVYQYDPEFREFFLQVKLGTQPHALPRPGGTSEAVIQHGAIIFADDAPEDPIVSTGSFVRDRDVRSCMAAPLIAGSECVGILYVNFFSSPHRFTEDEKRILAIIADHAAVAIQTIGRLHDANRQKETVLRSLEAIKECDTLASLLDTYLKISLREVGAESGTIQLLDRPSKRLVVQAAVGDVRQARFESISIDQGITGRAAREKHMIYVPDISTAQEEYLDYFGGMHCELAIPLLVNGELLGILNAEHSQIEAFDVYKRRLFELFATTAAVLIQERIVSEEAAREISAAKMTRVMAHHMKNYLGSARIQLDNVASQAELSQEQHEELARVDTNMKRCVGITQSLFKPYRASPRVEVKLGWLVENAVGHCAKSPDIEIVTSIPDALPEIWIEANNTVDYFHELLINAQKAIRKHLQEGRIDRGQIEVMGYLSDQGKVELLFTNNGPPIPQDRWEKIFEQFSGFSEVDTAEGFGLGLWGARTFFRRQGGDVNVLKSDESHTTFVVVLPIA